MKPYTITEVHYQGDITVLAMKDGSTVHLCDNTSGVIAAPGTPVVLLNEEEVDELYDAMLAFQTGSLPPAYLTTPDEEED